MTIRKPYRRPDKPTLRLQPTTLWDYPSQHYGEGMQGDQRYVGATPSYVIWNLMQRYTAEGELVVDPMCGSGTTLDVARDTKRNARGFDLVPSRKDIEQSDARKLPVDRGSVKLYFVDPPYGDHIDYSDDPNCIGKLSAFEGAYYREMGKVFKEAHRVIAPRGVIAVYVCDFYKKKRFAPVGFGLFSMLTELFEPIDHVCVTRHNHKLEQGNFRKAAEEGNFFLRGFNHLMILRRP